MILNCHLVQSASHVVYAKQMRDYLYPLYLCLSNDHHCIGLMWTKPIGHSKTNIFWFDPNIVSSVGIHAWHKKPLWMKYSLGIGYRHLLTAHRTVGIYCYYDYGSIVLSKNYSTAWVAPHSVQLGLEGRFGIFQGTLSGYFNHYHLESLQPAALLQLKDVYGGYLQIAHALGRQYTIFANVYARYVKAQGIYQQEYKSDTLYSYCHSVTRAGHGYQRGANFTLEYAWTDSQTSSISYTIDNEKQSQWIVAYCLKPKKTMQIKKDLHYKVTRYGGPAIFIDGANAIAQKFEKSHSASSKQKHLDFLKIVEHGKEAFKEIKALGEIQKQAVVLWSNLPDNFKKKPKTIEEAGNIVIDQAIKLLLRLPYNLREQLVATSEIVNNVNLARVQTKWGKQIVEALTTSNQHPINSLHSVNFFPCNNTQGVTTMENIISILTVLFKCHDASTIMYFVNSYPYFCEIYTGDICMHCRASSTATQLEKLLSEDTLDEQPSSYGSSSIFI